MKWNFCKCLIVCTAVFLFIISSSTYAQETLTLDPEHTYVLWHIKHFGFSTQTGKCYASGALYIDKDKPQNSKVNATVQMANLETGNAELDKHLKGKLFFDVEQFPTATFMSDKVILTSKTTAKVQGMMTIRGVSKPLVLNVKFNQAGVSPITDKMTAGFSAKTQLKRSLFGINALLPGLSDEVTIDIEAEAYLPNTPKP